MTVTTFDATKSTMLWTDIETLGLDINKHPVIEIGFALTDLDLEVLESKSWVIWEKCYENIKRDPFVETMHTKNGLLEECRNKGISVIRARHQVNEYLVDLMNRYGLVKPPLCGSSVHFDRERLNAMLGLDFSKLFSYRNIDVSSVKELMKRYNPQLEEKMLEPKSMHRVEPDLTDSIHEFGFYRDNFLFDARP